MNWNLLHFIESKKAVFYGEKVFLMPLKDQQYALLSEYQNAVHKDKASIEAKRVASAFEKYIDGLPPIERNANLAEGYVNRIMLCVSNDCNLRCKYCYAKGGNYGAERGLMTKEIADQFVDFCKRNFNRIDKIVFFGGEPLLNFKIIDYVCSRFENEQLGIKPEFGIITNGTIFSDKVLTILKKHIKFITVSIDGPEKINDQNRIFEDGSGSFARIINFISEIRKHTDINIQYEATFTKEHVQNGFEYDTLSKSLYALTGISGTVVTENNLDVSNMLNYLNRINKENMLSSNFENLPPDFWSVFNTVIHRRKEEMCGIGRDSFSVTYDGKIYLCHITNNKSKCFLQNITDMKKFSENIFSKKDFESNVKCSNCWAKNICGSCPVVRFYDTDKEEFALEPQQKYCNITQKLLDVFLEIIVTIRTDKELWSNIKKA